MKLQRTHSEVFQGRVEKLVCGLCICRTLVGFLRCGDSYDCVREYSSSGAMHAEVWGGNVMISITCFTMHGTLAKIHIYVHACMQHVSACIHVCAGEGTHMSEHTCERACRRSRRANQITGLSYIAEKRELCLQCERHQTGNDQHLDEGPMMCRDPLCCFSQHLCKLKGLKK